jgi:DNA-binding CsgD family transcriptional regulator
VNSSPVGTSGHCLRDIVSSPDYASRISDVIRQIRVADERSQVLELLHTTTRHLGVDISAFSSFTASEAARPSYRVLLACDQRWAIEYEKAKGPAHDPWLAYARAQSEPIRSSQIALSNSAEREIADLYVAFGFVSAVIVPTPPSRCSTRLGALFLGASKTDYFDSEGYDNLTVVARSVAMELNEWFVASIRAEVQAAVHLTDADLRLLSLVHAGHPTKEIARRLNRSPQSINSRLQRINAKLGVKRRKSAEKIATENDLI